jgi:hypothetical protein
MKFLSYVGAGFSYVGAGFSRPITLLLALVALSGSLYAQQRQGGPPPTARAAAPIDLTGYWVSVVTEDWRWRMLTPPKGDFSSIPLNAEGRRVAESWDPAAPVPAGEECRPYGAAALMRLPTRLHITWENDSTLKIETDAGQQTRTLVFGERQPTEGAPSWQGASVARWETIAEGQMISPTSRARALSGVEVGDLSGSLTVVTTRMRPGYLRRNGVPYSGNAVLTEHFDRVSWPTGEEWLIVTSRLDDPMYLSQPFTLSTHFKREPDASKWNPRPCEVVPPIG